MDLCSRCGKKEIKVKKRNLCPSCYSKLQSSCELPPLRKLTFEEKRQTAIKNIIKKYGPSLIGDLADLNVKRFITLDEIGQRYGITRERVRQIYQKIYRQKYGERKKERIEKHIDYQTCNNDPRRKLADYKDGLGKKGAIAEVSFLNECLKLGYDVHPECGISIDQNVNGYKVEIKASYSTSKTYSEGKTSYHHYNLSVKQLEQADFFACYHATSDSFFIIPKHLLKLKSGFNGKVKTLFIAAEISNYRSSKNTYWEFQNAWHLLERRQEVAA